MTVTDNRHGGQNEDDVENRQIGAKLPKKDHLPRRREEEMGCREGIVELLKVGPLDVEYIARRLGASREYVEEALRELEEGGVVERAGEKWRLAIPNDGGVTSLRM